MGKRTDLAVTDQGGKSKDSFVEKATDKLADKPDEVGVLLLDIEKTRGDMSRTVDEIEQRLSPAHVKEQIAQVKDSLLSNYHEAKDHIKEDIAQEVRVAKDKVKEEISEAKQMVRDEIDHAKEAVHDATIGKVKHLAEDAKNMAVDAGLAVKHVAVDAGLAVKHVAVDAGLAAKHAAMDAGEAVKHVAVDAGHSVTDAGATVVTAIRRNPIPAALIAVGAGWLAVSLLRGRSERRVHRVEGYDGGYGGLEPQRAQPPQDDMVHRAGHLASELGHRVADTASHLRRDVGETASEVGHKVEALASKVSHSVADHAHGMVERAADTTHKVGARVGDLGHRAAEGASALRRGAEHMAHDAKERAADLAKDANRQLLRAELTLEESYMANPLPYGALTLAVGAAIGLALPHTAREDAWIGDTKDRLMSGAGHLAQDALHSVQEKALSFTGHHAGEPGHATA